MLIQLEIHYYNIQVMLTLTPNRMRHPLVSKVHEVCYCYIY